jgi:hypothetical protein
MKARSREGVVNNGEETGCSAYSRLPAPASVLVVVGKGAWQGKADGPCP